MIECLVSEMITKIMCNEKCDAQCIIEDCNLVCAITHFLSSVLLII